MKRMVTRRSFLSIAAGAAAPALGAKGEYLMYVGTYTSNPKSKGIYVYKFDANTGKATTMGVAAEVDNPSFLAIHQNRKYLYTVGELGDFQGQRSGAVSAFSIDAASGRLTLLNQVPSRGTSPCHLNVDKTGRHLLVVNYGSGSTISVPIEPDGKLKEASVFVQHKGSSVNEKRQQSPHAHSVNLSSDNRFAMVADLGTDEVIVYKFDAATGALSANDPPSAKVKPGSGPRHFVFHPTEKSAYVINEIASTVTAFRYDKKKGVLTEIHTVSTLPPDWKGNNSTAEVRVHPTGKFLYGSNRGHNSIAVFQIDGSGKLTYVENTPTQGRTPRNFNIDPTGKFLIAENQQTDNMVIFQIDGRTGKLTPTGQNIEIPSPVCIRFLAV